MNEDKIEQPKVEHYEFPFATLNSFITPTNEFYVRSHFPNPDVKIEEWQLSIEGAVEQPFTLSFADLLQLPTRTLTVTLECAGNNRTALNPPVEGLQWGMGGVSTAVWRGVALVDVLALAGVKPEAVEVIAEGADKGEVKTTPKPAGEIHYARSIPLDHPVLADTLLAYEMNGEALTVAHGYPLRLIVPSWYAMASVKWLQRLIVTATPFQGYYQTTDYAFWQRVDGIPTRVPITTMQPKALIARPEHNEIHPIHLPMFMNGAAWSGDAEIVRVDISLNGGIDWHEAELLGEPVQYAWRLWRYRTPALKSRRKYEVMARATDSKGRTQPMQRDPDLENYVICHVISVSVRVY